MLRLLHAARGRAADPAVPLGRSSFRRCSRARMAGSMPSSAIRRLPAKTRSSAAIAKNYLPWLQTLHEGAHGNADLVAHFFRRAFDLLRTGGRVRADCDKHDRPRRYASIGSTAIICANGGAILRATAAAEMAGRSGGGGVRRAYREGRKRPRQSWMVDRCGAFRLIWSRAISIRRQLRLRQMPARRSRAHTCSAWASHLTMRLQRRAKPKVSTTMRALIAKDPRNAERIFPYIGGERSKH